MILFACDLDNTLIHSYKRAAENDICVELADDGKKLSYMTPEAYTELAAINRLENIMLVPLTTRSVEQYKRIKLFDGIYPHYAITSNGGNLLINNEIDKEWYQESTEMIKDSISQLNKAMEILDKHQYRQFEPRLIDGLFAYTKSDEPEKAAYELKSQLNTEVVSVFTHLQKVYALPSVLSKGTAVRRFKEKYGCDLTISAGDSGFDIPMLSCTDISFYPSAEFADEVETSGRKIIKSDNINFAEFICNEIKKIHGEY